MFTFSLKWMWCVSLLISVSGNKNYRTTREMNRNSSFLFSKRDGNISIVIPIRFMTVTEFCVHEAGIQLKWFFRTYSILTRAKMSSLPTNWYFCLSATKLHSPQSISCFEKKVFCYRIQFVYSCLLDQHTLTNDVRIFLTLPNNAIFSNPAKYTFFFSLWLHYLKRIFFYRPISSYLGRGRSSWD